MINVDCALNYVRELLQKGYSRNKIPFHIKISPEIANEVAQHQPSILRFIEQTEENMLKAIESWEGSDNIFQYITEQTEAICIAVVKKNPDLLAKVINQTESICIAAISIDIDAFKYVHAQTEPVIDELLRQIQMTSGRKKTPINHLKFGRNIQLIHNQDKNFEQKIIEYRMLDCIDYLRNPSAHLTMLAIEYDPYLFERIPIRCQTQEMIAHIWDSHPELLKEARLDLLDEASCIDSIKYQNLTLTMCPKRTPAIELAAVQTNWRELFFVTEFTEEICLAAYEQDVRALRFLWPQYGWEGAKENRYIFAPYAHPKNEAFQSHVFEEELLALDTQRKMEVLLHEKSINPLILNRSSRKKMDII